jgi:hypothetical protein
LEAGLVLEASLEAGLTVDCMRSKEGREKGREMGAASAAGRKREEGEEQR